ncbi:pantoate--beta-alanine ligase [Winogradskyella sp. DF17]|uniref:Pantothenate synthetase n=1 Tax=Winogradskyella pelagia TaxID=2819984 RepID=A0ABS3T5D7_9FLAO|nr:pantoate--beta-alanine ligase [Winogradskyella sp. DF17]
MQIFHHKSELRDRIESLRQEGLVIGFVPTMGALHMGHLSLVQRALDDSQYVVVSIFVNPTQFNNKKDLETYPRTLDADIALLKTVDSKKILVYAPKVVDIYGQTLKTERFDFDGLDNVMEGAYREGHFDGVGTIVKRLFEIVRPDCAFFGEKDYQQLLIIKSLVKKTKLPVKIIGCPIYRELDGLAMSSRNTRLSLQHRLAAPFIYKTLKTAKEKFGTKSAKYVTEWVEDEFKLQDLLDLEYVLIADSETLKPVKRKSIKKSYRVFIAVYAGDVRLIDNIALN